MSLLDRLHSPRLRAQTRDASNDFWYTPAASAWTHGLPITPEAALTLSALWKGTRLLSETIGSVPLLIYERIDKRSKERAVRHPLFDVLRWQPNQVQTALEFWEMGMGHLVLRGNFSSEILEGRRGFADQLVPIHPDKIRAVRLADGSKGHRRTLPTGEPKIYTQDEIFHVTGPGFAGDGLNGVSALQFGAQAFGVSLAAQAFAQRFFEKGAAPAFAAVHPKELGEEGLRNLRESISTYAAGSMNAHGVLVLEEGMTITSLGIKPEEAQMLLTQEHGVRDVARWLNMPATMLGDEATKTYASQEAFQNEVVMYTFRPWCVRIEQAVRRDLILATDRFYAEFLMDALYRGDLKTRYEAHRIGITTGFETPNEARDFEGWNPGPPALDEFLRPMNVDTPGSSGNRDRQARHGRAAAIVYDTAAGLVRKEIAAATKAAQRFAKDPDGWQAWLAEFYGDHAGLVADRLKLTPAAAAAYAERQRAQLAAGGVPVLAEWERVIVPALVEQALDAEVPAA